MTGFLRFHQIAAARGDGLHPRLVALLEQREAVTGGDLKITGIDAYRRDGWVQAGSGPRPDMPDFLPGNVVGFRGKAALPAASRKSSQA